MARYALMAAGLWYLFAFAAIALGRLGYPFELNWMEGAIVDHVGRILDGRRLYVAPSIDFVPFVYPPAFYYAAALSAQVIGLGFTALRLVSIASAFGIVALIFLFVRRETRSVWTGVVAACLYAATYRLGGTYADVGRVDSLFLVLLLAGFHTIRFGSSFPAATGAGVLLALAFLTKQSALVMAAPVVLYAMLRHPPRGITTAVMAGVSMAGVTLWLDRVHEGWYRFYVWELPSGYPVIPSRLLTFWTADVIPPLAITWAIGLISFAFPPAPAATVDFAGPPRGFYLSMMAGMVAGACLSRGNPGGNFNVLAPAFAALSIVFGLGLHRAWEMVSTLPSVWCVRGRAWLCLVALIQLGSLWYDPRDELPDRSSVQAGRGLVGLLTSAPGEVWVPYHGFLATMAGKRQYAHWMAVSDILQSRRPELRSALQNEVDRAIREHRFDVIVLSSRPFPNSPELAAAYQLERRLFSRSDTFMTKVGAKQRPELVYRPR